MGWARMGVCVVMGVLTLGPAKSPSDVRDKVLTSTPKGPFGFREVWGYLMKGEEEAFTGFETVTDVCYFSAAVNDIGRIDGTVARPPLPERSDLNRRIHLVISAPANKSLMYLCLKRDPQTRAGLIDDIVRVGSAFDGVQVDFEALRNEDGAAYVSFLTDLKAKCRGKRLSVAVPARTDLVQDAFDYAAIAAVADRVVVMAYDEHWRMGSPGPIASNSWCKKVCRFAHKAVGPNKLVMGLPLYGRAWQVEQYAKALKHQETAKLLKTYGKQALRDKEGTPYFQYQDTATVKVFFEDSASVAAKLKLYQDEGVRCVGFWRIGQGPDQVWSSLSVGP